MNATITKPTSLFDFKSNKKSTKGNGLSRLTNKEMKESMEFRNKSKYRD